MEEKILSEKLESFRQQHEILVSVGGTTGIKSIPDGVKFNNINTGNSTGNSTNGKIFLKYHYNMNILKILCNALVNYMWKMIMWKCAQYPQVKYLESALVVQIFNKESTLLKNKITRIHQNN
ncbi:hypothetical protein RFI_39900, partial [Reticulomyxa filosa]